MRVSKEKAAENRTALVKAASKLFREKGIDGFADNMAGMRAWAGDRDPGFADYMGVLLSPIMRDKLAAGCPMTASASDAARQGPGVSESYSKAFEEEVGLIIGSLGGGETPSAEGKLAEQELADRELAVAAVAAQIGAIAVARAVAQANPELSEEVLNAVRGMIMVAYGDRSESQ